MCTQITFAGTVHVEQQQQQQQRHERDALNMKIFSFIPLVITIRMPIVSEGARALSSHKHGRAEKCIARRILARAGARHQGWTALAACRAHGGRAERMHRQAEPTFPACKSWRPRRHYTGFPGRSDYGSMGAHSDDDSETESRRRNFCIYATAFHDR